MMNARFPSGGRSVGLLVVLAGGLALACGLSAQTAPTIAEEITTLKLGTPIETDFHAGQTDSYRIRAKAGQFLHVVVLQKGIDVVVTLFDPSGKQLAQSDLLNGAYGPELVSAIAKVSGAFRLDVSGPSKQMSAGKVEVKLGALRSPTSADLNQIKAERVSMEGAQLSSKPDVESRKIAAARFEESLRLWKTLGNSYEQGLALHSLADMTELLGDSQKALDLYPQAAVLRHAANDKVGEAATLRAAGWLYAKLGDNQKALDAYALALPLFREAGDAADEARLLVSMGLAHVKLKNEQKAIDDFNQAVILDHDLGDSAGEARALSNLGALYDSSGEAAQALDSYSRALPLWHSNGILAEEAASLSRMCILYGSTGQMQKALDCFNQALPLVRATGDREAEATTLNNMALVYSKIGQEQKALESHTQALTIFRATGNHKKEAVLLNNIGLVYNRMGERGKALDSFQQALALQRTANDTDGVAATMIHLGLLYAQTGEMQKALENYTQALPVMQASGNRVEEAATLANIARVYDTMGERKKALDFVLQALEIQRAIHAKADEAATLNNIASLYENLGELQKALEYFALALPAVRAVGDVGGEALTLNNIGMLYEVLNEPKKALDHFNQALSIAHAIGNREYEALSLSSIGEIDLVDRNFEQALERFNQALPIARAIGDRDTEGFLLIHIGETYLELHKAKESLDPLNQALSILRQMSDRDGEAIALDDLGETYRTLGEKQKATEYLVEGLAIAVQGNNPLHESDLYHDLMLNERANPPLSIYYGKQAVNYIQQMRGNIQGLDLKLQRRFLTSFQSTYRDLARQLIDNGRLPEAQQVLDLLKQQEYSNYVRGEKADAGSLITLTPAEQQAQQDYQKSTGQLVALGEEWAQLKKIPARTPDQDARYQQLSAQLDSASKGLNDYYARLYVLFGKNSDANKQIADVKGNVSLLKQTIAKAPHTVALYTMVTVEGYKVIVITGAAMVEREYAIPEKDLNQAVAAFQQVLRQPSTDPKPLAQQLYKILIGPVKADLDQAQARTLVFSLDGVLRYVPIAALYDGKQYLVENYSTVTITPVSIPHLAEKPDVSNLKTLAMGISQKFEGSLPPLPSVVGELDDIVSDAQVQGAHGVLPGTILLDRQFTEKAMENQLDSPHGVVHIASHFVFKPGDDSQSYLLLSGEDQGGTGFHLTVADFRDNQKLALDDTELLTLSACETGMSGDANNGREVDGLGTTAQLKGARAVISSLWEVNDSSTGELMADFYKRWVSGAGAVEKVEALRQAQLDLLLGKTKPTAASEGRGFAAEPPAVDLPQGYAHPYYWAPFVLMGNWR
jgi:CHAT domain-containing protein/Tfp pilus assembly protein PilF